MSHSWFICKIIHTSYSSSSSSGTEIPLVGGFGLHNDILPVCSILNTGYPIFNLHLTNVLYDIDLPSILGHTSYRLQK